MKNSNIEETTDTRLKNEGRRKPTGSVDSFWQQHPRLAQFKSFFDGAIELGFLIKAAYVIDQDKDLVCEGTHFNQTFEKERIRLSIDLMAFIHALHLARLIFSQYTKYSKHSNAFQGCLNCLLVDCYCCAGTAVYLYT